MRGTRLLAWAPLRRAAQPQCSHLRRLRVFKEGNSMSCSTICRAHAQLFPTSSTFCKGLRTDVSARRPRIIDHVRFLSSTARRAEAGRSSGRGAKTEEKGGDQAGKESDDVQTGFELSEKGVQASQVNLSAKLAKEGTGGKKPAFHELRRLLKIARPEAKTLALAIFFLIVSSSIGMSVPFAIGKVIDTTTKGAGEESAQLFGLSLPMFYGMLGAFLVVGAAANFGRVITLRIVGERIIARLRSKLYQHTFLQDAEFFDANRVGDLISRLSSDTLIVVKSVTQNLSDGLRAAMGGIAGFGMMAYVSIKLSSILVLLLPPVGLCAFFYGRAMRQLSRRIQKSLGTLTKISEERLGNVKTSQSFAGEILEVHRYNRQIRKIFQLGKREAMISATFFGSVSCIF